MCVDVIIIVVLVAVAVVMLLLFGGGGGSCWCPCCCLLVVLLSSCCLLLQSLLLLVVLLYSRFAHVHRLQQSYVVVRQASFSSMRGNCAGMCMIVKCLQAYVHIPALSGPVDISTGAAVGVFFSRSSFYFVVCGAVEPGIYQVYTISICSSYIYIIYVYYNYQGTCNILFDVP